MKKILIPAFVVVALAVIAVLVFQPWRSREVVPVPSDKASLAVMYFKNNTGDDRLDHWRSALSDLLITDLSQSRHIKILSAERLFNILHQLDQLGASTYSSDVLKELAGLGGVESVFELSESHRLFPEGHILVALYKGWKERISSFVHQFSG